MDQLIKNIGIFSKIARLLYFHPSPSLGGIFLREKVGIEERGGRYRNDRGDDSQNFARGQKKS